MRLPLLMLLALSTAHAQAPAFDSRAQCSSPVPKIGPSGHLMPIRSVAGDNLELPELSTQAHVYTAAFKAQMDEQWVEDCLNLNLDFEQFGCKIVAYRIQWFTGRWSGWFVPGVNDLYKKPGETLRRYWACFNDHSFEIIYQTSGKPIDFAQRHAEKNP